MKRIFKKLMVSTALAALCLISAVSASEHTYTINNVFFTDLGGNELVNPTTSCMVNISATKNTERVGNDSIVIASYATDGTLIGFTVVTGTVETGNTANFSTLVSVPDGKQLGVIKAYVWNNIGEMEPLSKTFTEVSNTLDEGVTLPDINEPAVEEAYIPSHITVRGVITDTPLSSGLEEGTYDIEFGYIGDPTRYFGLSRDEYFYEVERQREISSVYSIDFGRPLSYEVYSDLDLNNYLFVPADMTITMDRYGNYYVTNFAPIPSKDIITFDASDYVPNAELSDSRRYSQSGEITIGNKSYYAEEIEIYIDGESTDYVRNHDSYSDSVLDDAVASAKGDIRLIRDSNDSRLYRLMINTK